MTTQLTTLLCGDPVDGIVAVSLCPDSPADSNGGSRSFDGLSIGINVGDSELDGSVVFGGYQSV